MPIDPDFVRNERIKRLRTLVRSGTEQMLILHDAIPAYLRQSTSDLRPPIKGLEGAAKLLAALPDSIKREQAIQLGFTIAERNHKVYSRVYKWLVDADNASPRNLGDGIFQRYRSLDQPFKAWIDPTKTETVEAQILHLSQVLEDRITLFAEQLRVDGEHEDIAPALRDAPGGWPHLRTSGLLSDSVLDGYLARMRKRRTKAEISNSIGAAKEVTEATMKALGTKHGALPAGNAPDLSDYWKSLRPFLVDSSVDQALGGRDGSMLRLVSAEVSTIQTLGELRNRVGSGHGRAAHPAGLQSAHALFAVDTAHSVTRFLTA